MEVQEALSKVGVSHEVELLVPTTCSSCFYPYEVNDTLTVIECVNPFCPSKLAQRAVYMCQLLDITGFGESFFKAFFKGTDSQFISDLITLREGYLDDYLDFYDWRETGVSYTSFENKLSNLAEIMTEKRKSLTLVNYIKALALPNLQSRVDSIFKDYTIASDFYDKFDEVYEETEMLDLLGLTEGSIETAISLVQSLSQFKEDVLGFESKGFNFFVPVKGDVELKVVCSKAVGKPFRSKRDFYNYVDEHYADKVNIVWSNSATKSCDVLIWAGVSQPDEITSKVDKICRFNSQGSHIPILSAQMFLDLLETASDGFVVKDTLDGMELENYVGD